jgi:hypothetical protein
MSHVSHRPLSVRLAIQPAAGYCTESGFVALAWLILKILGEVRVGRSDSVQLARGAAGGARLPTLVSVYKDIDPCSHSSIWQLLGLVLVRLVYDFAGLVRLVHDLQGWVEFLRSTDVPDYFNTGWTDVMTFF